MRLQPDLSHAAKTGNLKGDKNDGANLVGGEATPAHHFLRVGLCPLVVAVDLYALDLAPQPIVGFGPFLAAVRSSWPDLSICPADTGSRTRYWTLALR